MRAKSFFEIWFRPRATIRSITENNPNTCLWILSWILGFLLLFNSFQIYSFSTKVSFFLLVAVSVILAPLAGYLYLNVASWILVKTGRWVRGKAHFQDVRAALAWSSAPLSASVLLWFLLLGLFGSGIFAEFPGGYLLTQGQIYVVMGITLAQVGFSLWSMVLYVHNLAEVQKFSIAHAIINTILACFSVIALSFFLWMVAIWIWAQFL